MENINKVWGERRRLHIDKTSEIDLLYLKKDTFCSTHNHKTKINKFVVVKGKVRIETEFGKIILTENCIWVVRPPLLHRFCALEDSTMIEFAYVEAGTIDPEDIDRISLGGKIIDGEECPIDILEMRGLLEL